MKSATRLTAIVTAAMFMFALAQPALADDRDGSRRSGASTTEKVLTVAAVTAVAGLLIYSATRDDDRHHYRRDYRDRYDQRRYDQGRYDQRRQYDHYRQGGYVAFETGFNSYCVGDPRDGRNYREPRGYWQDMRGHRFYRVPFRYNPRFDRAYNAGWERGYWAGYLQGLNDGRARSYYNDRFQWNGGRQPLWGYNSSYGSAGRYEDAFCASFSVGYRHAYRGYGYGHEGFGFNANISYRR